jgi:2-keto-3-deoxy-L-rhamnonate aldolase RhmA
MNSLLLHLTNHPLTCAINVGGPSLDNVNMLAVAGAKCLFIDCERNAIHIESAGPIVRAAKSHGMLTMLRSENKQAETLIRYLDRGAKYLSCTLQQIIQQGFQSYRSIPL